MKMVKYLIQPFVKRLIRNNIVTRPKLIDLDEK